eukprot:TRINITY_DN51336_c0_g1_i2.p1 TRINITY_DN51336_c0_g1~~TRINITY_DN51336_c0_g1_i2.p1  ORF type:complete len:630 (+),score=163.99 TRINITY_DN51336_c0_g1_i2:136-2025(+)
MCIRDREVDNIILLSLRQIGCQIPEETAVLSEFSTEMLFSCCAKILRTIDDSLKFPKRIPSEETMSSRFRVCTNLATAVEKFGYTGDIGYNQFMYPNEKETRKILSFLLETMPKDEEEEAEEVLGPNAVRNRAILAALAEWAKRPWFPSHLATPYRKYCQLHTVPLEIPEDDASLEREAYHTQALALVTAQPSNKAHAIPSILETLSAQMGSEDLDLENDGQDLASSAKGLKSKGRISGAFKSAINSRGRTGNDQSIEDMLIGAGIKKGGRAPKSAFVHQTEFLQEKQTTGVNIAAAANLQLGTGGSESVSEEPVDAPDQPKQPSKEELQAEREKEVATLQETLSSFESAAANLQRSISKRKAQIRKLEMDLDHEEAESAQLHSEHRVTKRTFELLPEIEKNLQGLRQITGESGKKLMQLATEWEAHRKPLLDEYRTKKAELYSRRTDFDAKVAKIKEMRRQMKEMLRDLQNKEERYRALLEEYERLPKNLNRVTFISRISDMVGKVRKQNQIIDKHLADTRTLQLDINSTSDKLNRSYAATDARLFKDVGKDADSKELYRNVANIHQSFTDALDELEGMNRLAQEKYNLEANVKQLQELRLDLEQVTKDLGQVKSENKALVKKLGLKK